VIIRDHPIMIGTRFGSEHQQSVDSYVSMLCDLSHLEQLCRLYQVSDIKRINYERALAAYIITSAQRSISSASFLCISTHEEWERDGPHTERINAVARDVIKRMQICSTWTHYRAFGKHSNVSLRNNMPLASEIT